MTSQGRRGQRSESERRRGTSAARRSASGTVALGEAALVLRGGHGGFERWFLRKGDGKMRQREGKGERKCGGGVC